MTEKKDDFDFQIAGTNKDNNIMVLVDDYQYGKSCYIIEDIDEKNKVQYSMVKTFVENIPEHRQDRIVTAILEKLVLESREI
jgi:hypothetical protein